MWRCFRTSKDLCVRLKESVADSVTCIHTIHIKGPATWSSDGSGEAQRRPVRPFPHRKWHQTRLCPRTNALRHVPSAWYSGKPRRILQKRCMCGFELIGASSTSTEFWLAPKPWRSWSLSCSLQIDALFWRTVSVLSRQLSTALPTQQKPLA